MSKPLLKIDKEQFEELFQRNWKRLYAFASRTVVDEEDGKEIVQDVFKSLWERKDELELLDAERYLLRSVKLRCLECLRNRGNKHRHHQVILHNNPAHYEENSFNYKELNLQLNHVVEALPDQCKNVFKLSREEGLSNKEIADSLFISERAVQYHIKKALSVIKLKLSKRLNILNPNRY